MGVDPDRFVGRGFDICDVYCLSRNRRYGKHKCERQRRPASNVGNAFNIDLVGAIHHDIGSLHRYNYYQSAVADDNGSRFIDSSADRAAADDRHCSTERKGHDAERLDPGGAGNEILPPGGGR